MKPSQCQHEAQVARVARSGEWDQQLRAHVAQCKGCAEVALVAEFLRQEPRAAEFALLPSAGQVWWRAQIRARQADAERALQPVRWVQRFATVCVLIGALLLIGRYAPQLQDWIQHLAPGTLDAQEPVAWVFLGTAVMFVAAISAGLGYMRHWSK
jgi:hypothetical protein